MDGFFKFAAIFLFVLVKHSYSTEVRNCTGIPAAYFVDIYNCDKPPCQLPQRSTAVMEITFRVPKYHKQISPEVLATVAGTTTPYPLNPDGCPLLQNGYCPVTEGEVLIYRFEMPISILFPRVTVDLEFKLTGDNREPLTCFRITCVVVAPVSNQILKNSKQNKLHRIN